MNVSFIRNANGLISRQSELKTIGKEIIFYEETVSTNDDVFMLSEEHREGLVVVANSQSGGRGRHGRWWFSPPGVNLYFSILLRPNVLPDKITLLSLMTSVGVVKGIRRYTGIHTSIKWPNDIMIRDKKMGGILMEARTERGKIDVITIGIGLNINMTLDMIPDEIRGVATSLRIESGGEFDRFRLLEEVLEQIDCLYGEFLKGGIKGIINEWLALNSTIGHKVIVLKII